MSATIIRTESKRGKPTLTLSDAPKVADAKSPLVLNAATAVVMLELMRTQGPALLAAVAELAGERATQLAGRAAKADAKAEAREAKAKASADAAQAERLATPAAKLPTPAPVKPGRKAKLLPVPTANEVAATAMAALVAEGKAAGVKGAHLYKDPAKLRAAIADKLTAAEIAACKSKPARKAAKPAKAAKSAPAPKASEPAPRAPVTILGDFVNKLPDGREVYTVVFSDGTTAVEITGSARKAA